MPSLSRTFGGLALGALGGGLFFGLSLPLPWMLGALFLTMAASLTGLPVQGPNRLRPAIVAVIGVLLGARFTPDVVPGAAQAAITLAVLAIYLVAVAALVVPFYRFFGRQDWTTAYFAGMPGGLAEMIELGEARGADVPAIILAHSLRLVLTIGLMVLLFRLVLDHDLGGSGNQPYDLTQMPSLPDAVLLTGCAIVGAFGGTRLRLPAPSFLGPLILSAAAHLTGITEGLPPPLLINAAQVALGTILGGRFLGIAPRTVLRAGLLSLGATLITLALALVAAQAMRHWAGISPDQALLALAPGGLTEMSLIALAIHADVAFVALHHVARILLIIVGAPLLLRVFFTKR